MSIPNFKSMKVDEVKEFAIKGGYCTEQDLESCKGKTEVVNYVVGLINKKQLNTNVEDAVLHTEVDMEPPTDIVEASTPFLGDIGWSNFVLSQLQPSEFFKEYPKVDGLRRIASVLLGPTISSTSKIYSHLGNSKTATVRHRIVIHFLSSEDNRTFDGTSEVTEANSNPVFYSHAVSTAETKAEGRALRRALQLNNVVTAEEMDAVLSPTNNTEDKITDTQINFIDTVARNLNINVTNLINGGDVQYKNIKAISRVSATEILASLNEYQRENKKIPENLVGYDSNWKVTLEK